MDSFIGATLPDPAAPSADRSTDSLAPFEAALGPLLERAYVTAFRLTGSEEAAVALVQAASFAALQEVGSAGADFATRFLAILVREYRRLPPSAARTTPAFDLDDTPDLYLFALSIRHGLPFGGPDPAGPLLEALGPDRVARAMNFLPEEYRVPCILSLTQDLGYQALATVLGSPVGAVRTRLHRGRKMLQKALWQVALEDGIVETLRTAAR